MRKAIAMGLLLGTACTEVPATEELAWADDLQGDERVAVIPDGAVRTRVLAPTLDEPEDDAEPAEASPGTEGAAAGPPRIVVTRWDKSRIEEYGMADGTALCPFDVEATGFPAVSTDGATVAHFTAETLSSSDGEDEIVTVGLLDVATDHDRESIVIVDGDENLGTFHCWRWYRRAQRRAKALNATFASGWRPMEALPLAHDYPYDDEDPDEDAAAESPRTRPIEVTRLNREVIVRVPGVKVLARAPADWQIEADDPSEGACWFDAPIPAVVWGDRETGVGMVTVEQIGGPCFCYSPTEHHSIPLTAETFTEIDRRNAAA